MEEISDNTKENLKLKSLAHRISRLPDEDYGKMLEDNNEKSREVTVNHEENMRKAGMIWATKKYNQ